METVQAPKTRPANERGTSMRAVVQDEYGEAERVLRLEEIERPDVGEHDVLVQVQAVGMHRGVWHMVTGLPYPIRLAGYGFRAPKNRVPSGEIAGRAAAVGSQVTGFNAGDEVFGTANGAFAEFVSAREDKLALKPKGLSVEQAAAVPISGLTALQAIRDQAGVQPGQRVLVIGASGGVGSFAVQVAKAFGAEVTGVCSTTKIDLVRSIGADHVIDYLTESFTDGGQRYDAVIDTGGNRPLRQLRRALAPRGTLVIVGAETGGRWLGGTDRQLRAMALSPFIGQKLGTFISSENARDLGALSELIESGQVRPVIDRAFALSEVPAAIRHMVEGRARGKVVVTV